MRGRWMSEGEGGWFLTVLELAFGLTTWVMVCWFWHAGKSFLSFVDLLAHGPDIAIASYLRGLKSSCCAGTHVAAMWILVAV